MNAQEFAVLADKLYLSSSNTNEALNRTIIGRWYYSAYHEVKDWLEINFSEEFSNTVGKTHEKLTICCDMLQRMHMDLAFSRLGRLLSELKNLRVLADYKLGVRCTKFEVDSAKLKFDEIYNQLEFLKSKYK